MSELEPFTTSHEVNLEAFNEVNIERTAQEAFTRLSQEFPWAIEISPEEQILRQEEEDNNNQARLAGVRNDGSFKQVQQEAIPTKHSLMLFRKAFAERVDALPFDDKRRVADLLYGYTSSVMVLKGYEEIKVLWERAKTADVFWLNDLVKQMSIDKAAEYFENEKYRYQDEMVQDYKASLRKRGEKAFPLKVEPSSFSPGERFHYASNNFYATYCSVYDTGKQEGFPAGKEGIKGEIAQRVNEIINNLGIQPTGGGITNFYVQNLTYLPALTQMYREGYSQHDLAG